ncbi:hypothetical protein HZP25_15745 [Elizabethkingia anophelis]|nr:hypothetical protein [Elizabethkingia anophelis]
MKISFATTVTLGNNVSMESVSKMLGHKSIKTTYSLNLFIYRHFLKTGFSYSQSYSFLKCGL